MRYPSPCKPIFAATVLFITSATALAQSEKAVSKTVEIQPAGQPAELDPTKTVKTVHTYRAAAGALAWLARQQHPDGSWDFRDGSDRDKPKDADAGRWQSKTGATGLVLKAFLAAGQTHKSRGPYQETVAAGLQFLMHQADGHAEKERSGIAAADLCGEGGDLIWHAAATTALCEAYGLTGDKEVGKRAQMAIDFIIARQDRQTGGWAARPGGKSATSVTACQIMALKSGCSAGLKMDAAVFDAAGKFLQHAQSDDAAGFGETGPGKEPAATAMGLLCRQYLGGKRDDPAMQRGVEFLMRCGPSKSDLLYNDFATRVLHNMSGYEWDRWNRMNRKMLVECQAREGPEEGSWWIAGEVHTADGGRLFQTAIVTATLMVYYRYLPLFTPNGAGRSGWRSPPERSRSASFPLPPLPAETWQPSRLVPNTSRLTVGQGQSLPLKAMQADISIDGFRARVRLDLYFFDDRPEKDVPQGTIQREGTFQLRLPGSASPYYFAFGATVYSADAGVGRAGRVAALEQLGRAASDAEKIAAFRNDGWTQPRPARLVPREAARTAYGQTVWRGVDPALVEWAGEGLFHCRVFPLQPQQLHRIVIGYDVDLLRAGDDLELPVDLPEDKIPVVVDIHAPVDAATRLTVDPRGSRSVANGRVRHHFANPGKGPIRVRLREPGAVVLAGDDPQTGAYFAARFRPELPADPAARGSSRAVFLVDTSHSAKSQPFHLRLKLLRALLERNRPQIEQFAVLWFDVEPRWWHEGFLPNTPENVDRLMKSADGLTLDGATDLGQALTEGASPRWLDKHQRPLAHDLFLLSDGAVTWGEQDWPALAEIARSAAPGRLFAYSASHGGPGPLLSRLAGSSGGAALCVASEAEISLAATAHRTAAWRLEGVSMDGATDLLLAGRPEYLFPGQEVLLAGRGDVDPADAVVELRLARGDTAMTLRTRLTRVVRSPLAARSYGEVAVGQLEELGEATERDAARYARHFDITGRTCSLVMLERDEDYEQFDISPVADALAVKQHEAAAVVAHTLEALAGRLADPKARFLAWLGRADGSNRDEDVCRRLPATTRRAIELMPEASFAVPASVLRCNLGGDKGPALRTLSSWVADRPNDPALLRRVALSALDWRLYGQAYGLLRRAAEIAPGDARIYHLLARCLDDMGQADLAIVLYELAYDGRFDYGDDGPAVDVAIDYLRLLRREIGGRLSPDVAKLARLRLAAIAAECDLREADLVVSIRWNTDGTDVDLHVAEPGGEECCYYHPRTANGGQLGPDVRDGIGPETYVLRNGAKGKYAIRACSLGNVAWPPTKVYATIYEHWGTSRERVTRRTVTLARAGTSCDLGTVFIDHGPDGGTLPRLRGADE